MSGIYCIHCGLLMSSAGVTGEKATPGAAAVAGGEAMLHCPNCGGGNSRENSVCGWCETVLPWAQENAEAAHVAPEVIAATLPAAEPAPAAPAPVPAPAPSVASTYLPPAPEAPQEAGVPAPEPVIDESVLAPGAAAPRPRAWVLFASLTGFAVFATLIVWSATRKPATTVVTGGAPPAAVEPGPASDDGQPAPDAQDAAQAASDAQAEVQEKADAAQKATAEANAAARRAADARRQLDAAKAQGPKDAAALAAAQEKARQAQAEAEDAQAKAQAAQAATDAANARADQAARDAAAAQAKAAENTAAQPPADDATPAPAASDPGTRLSVRFLKSGDSVKLKSQGNTAAVDMRVDAVVTSSTGENISRAYVRNVGRKNGLVSRVFFDVRGPNEELVSTRRPVSLRWDGGISMQYAKSVEGSSPADVAALLPTGTYIFRVYRNANDTVSMGQYEFTLTN